MEEILDPTAPAAPADEEPARPSEESTLKRLVKRMARKRDFPALAGSVSRLNQLVYADRKDLATLSAVISRDVGLTQKILKAVNSVYYGPFAGKIESLSRAVVVLGTAAVRSVAATLAFLDNLQDRAEVKRVKAQLSQALYTAVLARELMGGLSPEQREEAFLGGMLSNLGRLLVVYYLPEEWAAIGALEGEEGLPPEKAQRQVLGTDFEAIGRHLARQWNFPSSIVDAIRSLDGEPPARLSEDAERLRAVINLAREATEALLRDGRKGSVIGLLAHYAKAIPLDDKAFDALLQATEKEFEALQGSAMTPREREAFLRDLRLGRLTPGEERGPAEAPEAEETEVELVVPGAEEEPEATPPSAGAQQQGLTQALQEVSGLLLGDYRLPELFDAVLRGMHRAVGFRRVVLCLADERQREMSGRLGLGEEAQALTRQMRLPLAGGRDVFFVSINKGNDVYIEDATKEGFQTYLPEWFRAITTPGSFLLLPIMTGERPMGLIYGEFSHARGLAEGGEVLDLLKSLRNQLVLGLRGNR